jgi:hypothetical protein
MPFSDTKLTDEPGRLAALRRYHVLDTEPEPEFDELIELATTIFGLPAAAISLLDSDQQWFEASAGLEVTETPRSLAFCHHRIQGVAPLAVEDARDDPRFAAHPAVTAEGGLRRHLGLPLTTPEGYNVAALCLPDLDGASVTVSGGVAPWHPGLSGADPWLAKADAPSAPPRRPGPTAWCRPPCPPSRPGFRPLSEAYPPTCATLPMTRGKRPEHPRALMVDSTNRGPFPAPGGTDG